MLVCVLITEERRKYCGQAKKSCISASNGLCVCARARACVCVCGNFLLVYASMKLCVRGNFLLVNASMKWNLLVGLISMQYSLLLLRMSNVN